LAQSTGSGGTDVRLQPLPVGGVPLRLADPVSVDVGRPAGFPTIPALPEPILAAIEGGENTRDVRNARALLAQIW
jgi:hypothetical protein